MARFELNGTIYEANDKGNYFYKSTGTADKNGNPIMKRVSREVYEQAFDEYAQNAKDAADKAEAEADKQTEENFNKKHMDSPQSALEANKKYVEKQKKARRSKDVAFEQEGVTLTAKQVNFIKEAQQTNFYEHGVQSTLWCDVLVEEIGGEFAGKPMTVGAMISTLKEKGLVYIAVEKVNNKKSKYFGFTELGQKVLEGLE